MEEGLPKSFDVVIIGTGVTESIISAASSRNGHSVLHLDPRDYYGSLSATLNFDSWTCQEYSSIPSIVSVDNEKSLNNSGGQVVWKNCIHNVEQVWYDGSNKIREDFDKNKRKFNIDVFPQVILAREEIIELLITSDVSRYMEFLRVGKLFTKNEDVIVSIPLSRSDIFTSKSVSLGEKRCLVKFIEGVMKEQDDPATNQESDNNSLLTATTFDEMATSCKLTPKVKHLIRSVVENVEDEFSSEENFQTQFISRCRKYLKSIGRFGNQTPYLWPLYGISEICQSFCRLSAVYGGIFILKRFITSIEEETTDTEERLLKIKSENDEFLTKHLILGQDFRYIMNDSNKDDHNRNNTSKTVGRGVIVTLGSSLKADTELTTKGDGICLYKIGKLQIVELSSSSQAVPKNYRLLQITFAMNDDKKTTESPRNFIQSQLESFVDFSIISNDQDKDKLDDIDESVSAVQPHDDNPPNNKTSKPQAIYASFFWIDLCNEPITSSSSKRVFNCAVDSSDLTCQINRAISIFNTMFPGEEFLPKPPNPDPEETDDNDNVNEVTENVEVVSPPSSDNDQPPLNAPARESESDMT